MKLTVYQTDFDFPAAIPPEWADKVERWYQLDAAAFGLTEIYWRNRSSLVVHPSWLLLCSPAGSNATDSQFALSAPSPAKFVHTLPNIRSAALLQAMGWSGSVLCLQNDPNTILTGLSEGLSLFDLGAGPVWIASFTEFRGRPCAQIAVLDNDGALKIAKTGATNMANPPVHDTDWLSWISQPKSPSFQGNGLTIG